MGEVTVGQKLRMIVTAASRRVKSFEARNCNGMGSKRARDKRFGNYKTSHASGSSSVFFGEGAYPGQLEPFSLQSFDGKQQPGKEEGETDQSSHQQPDE